jgi:hypothetical protein
LGLPGDLISNIINKKAYRKPQKLPGSPQVATTNLRAEILTIFQLQTMTPKDISKLTDL